MEVRRICGVVAFAAAVLFAVGAGAEESGGEESKSPLATAETPFAVTASYFGETITHPGATIGVEYYARETWAYKLVLSSNLGWYRHRRNHQAALLDVEVGGRMTSRLGFYGETSVGLGYFHRFADATVYEVDGSGRVSESERLGSPALMGLASFGVGWDFRRNYLPPISVNLRAGVFGEYPYNQYILAHFFLRAGIAYRF